MPAILVFIANKRITFAVILAFLLIAGGFWISSKSGDKKPPAEKEISVSSKKSPPKTSDSGDGELKDWEKELWQTYASELGVSETTDKEKTGQNTPVETSLTKKIARDAFQNYIEQVNLGAGEADAQQQVSSRLTQDIQRNIATQEQIKDEFSREDIKISKDSSKEALGIYIGSLAEITTKEAEKLKEGELTLLTKLVEDANARESREKFGEFESYITAYNNSVKQIVDINAPENIYQHHLNLLNALNNSAKINTSFANFMSDPVMGVFAIQSYLIEREKILDALSGIYNYGIVVGL